MSDLTIQNPYRFKLPLMQAKFFERYFRAIIKLRLRQNWVPGLGGVTSMSFIHLLNRGGQIQGQLHGVVKMGPSYMIQREKLAYEEHIENNLHRATSIINYAVDRTGQWGGLYYRLTGKDIKKIQSLSEFLEEREGDQIQKALNTLDGRLTGLWSNKRPQQGFIFRLSYDYLLPVNFVIEPVEQRDAQVNLTPKQIAMHGYTPQLEDILELRDFIITEIEPQLDAKVTHLTLNCPTDKIKPNHYRIRLVLPSTHPFLQQAKIDQLMPEPFTGRVKNTRDTVLRQEIGKLFAGPLNLDEKCLSHPTHQPGLQNPLLKLDESLSKTMLVQWAKIHGDLNIENILFDEFDELYIIDFADAREDHILHDFLRLEAGIVTRLLPKAFAEAGWTPDKIYEFFEKLHQAASDTKPLRVNFPTQVAKYFEILTEIRLKAKSYLGTHNDYTDYLHGLLIYLMGALKFKNLDEIPGAKRIAFWGAATVANQVYGDPPNEACPKKNPVWVLPTIIGLTLATLLIGGFVYVCEGSLKCDPPPTPPPVTVPPTDPPTPIHEVETPPSVEPPPPPLPPPTVCPTTPISMALVSDPNSKDQFCMHIHEVKCTFLH